MAATLTEVTIVRRLKSFTFICYIIVATSIIFSFDVLTGYLDKNKNKDKVVIKKFDWYLKPYDILIEAEVPNGQRGIYVVRLIESKSNRVKAKVSLIIPQGARPRWSPERRYVLFEWRGRICVADRHGTCVFQRGTMLGYPVYGWGPDDNTILVGADRYLGSGYSQGLGFQTFWKEQWEDWTDVGLGLPIGIPAQYGITFPHAKLPDYLWLSSPTMSPDYRMHAFEAFRPVPNYGRTYSKIYIVKWVKGPKEARNWDWLPIFRLTNLPDKLWEVNPKWSPDGKWIAFEVIDTETFTHRVYIASPHENSVVHPVPLPPHEDESGRIFYESMRYTIVKWLSEEELLTRLDPPAPRRPLSSITFWLINIKNEKRSFLFSISELSENSLFAVSHIFRSIVVISDNGFRTKLILYTLPEENDEGDKRENKKERNIDYVEVKGFPENMVVYWVDW